MERTVTWQAGIFTIQAYDDTSTTDDPTVVGDTLLDMGVEIIEVIGIVTDAVRLGSRTF